MSGGHFNYDQYKIGYIADELEEIIESNHREDLDKWGCCNGRHYPAEVIARFREAVTTLRIAQIYAHRADWLLSGDDGDESFLRRLEKELSECANTAGSSRET